jgi:hyperosmotically inducible periplasmic protein
LRLPGVFTGSHDQPSHRFRGVRVLCVRCRARVGTGTRIADFTVQGGVRTMRPFKNRLFVTMTLAMLFTLALATCTSTTGRTVGENVDDATITSEVKAKLAAEKVSTLTKIGVDTDRRTVYLTGTVDSAEMRTRAEEIARGVKHVSGVVNNLTLRAQ